MQPSSPRATVVVGALLVLLACGPSGGATAPAAKAPAVQQPAAAAAPQAAAASSAQPASSPALQQLIEGARGEGTLRGLWSGETFGGPEGFEALVRGMNQRYGLSITPQFTPGPNMLAVIERVMQEAQAGRPASTDVYMGNAPAVYAAMQTPALQSVDWASVLERPLAAEAGFDPIAPNGIAIAYATTFTGVTYNTTLVRGNDVPRRLDDLLKPQWKGQIASTINAGGLREFAAGDLLGREYTYDFTRKLAAQTSGLIRCGEVTRISSGEFAMLAPDCGGTELFELKQQGAPIDQALLDDVGLLHMRYLGVPLTSRSPNAATLFILYVLSPEGQALLWKHDWMDLHLYAEAQTRPLAERIRASGAKVAVNSPQWLAQGEDFSQVQRDLAEILRRGGQ
jgi:iron(III) transport system substrate-binding protein